jgi:hypothetical protein
MSGEGVRTATAVNARVVSERRGDYLVSTDPALLDIDVVAGFLARSYWEKDRTRETLERAIASSLCIGIYRSAEEKPASSPPTQAWREQIGFARHALRRATD